MPKVAGKVLASKIVDGKMLAKLALNGRLPPVGVNISLKWGSQRSKAQNALLWAYYTWVIEDGGLKEWGFFTPEALHASLKAHFLGDKIMTKGEWQVVEEGSTADMNKTEFSEYMEKIDLFLVDFFAVDTSPFWEEYKANKSGVVDMNLTEEGKRWQEENQ
jgi:hypothetical protein